MSELPRGIRRWIRNPPVIAVGPEIEPRFMRTLEVPWPQWPRRQSCTKIVGLSLANPEGWDLCGFYVGAHSQLIPGSHVPFLMVQETLERVNVDIWREAVPLLFTLYNTSELTRTPRLAIWTAGVSEEP